MARTRIAAAVLLTRGRGTELELFVAKRAAELSFFGGYWAFLGGVVDAADHDGEPDEVAALMRCAWREVFEEAGVLPAALAQLRKAGSCVILGTGMQRPRIDPNRILLNELTLTGGYNYDRDGFPQALELLASGKLPIDDLIESTDVELGDLQQAMEGLVGGQVAGKVLVAPRS